MTVTKKTPVADTQNKEEKVQSITIQKKSSNYKGREETKEL